MMRGLLLYNPQAGRNREARAVLVERIAQTLRSFGYELSIAETTHRGSATAQTRAAIAAGAEVVFACGGDGTVHEVLQGIVGTTATLAIIPMGSGNALSRELHVPLDPLKAARSYAFTRTIDVRISQCTLGDQVRAFLVMAGAGPDGALMYQMLAVDRSRWGRWGYAAHALRLFVRGRFTSFAVRYQPALGGCWEARVVSAMAMRVGSLGGVFPGIARGASLQTGSMRLVLVKSPAYVALPLWFAMNWMGLERWNPLLVTCDVTAFECYGNAIHGQVDGEWMGRLPMRVNVSDAVVRLTVPARR
jgi:diacylglycerol kinase family enzyme